MHTVCEYKNIVYYFYMDSRREYVRSDVGSSPMRMSIQDVEKLKTKPVQRLVLLQCSVGKIEKAGENTALAFARSVTGKVLAGDGVVNQNEVLHLMEKCIDYIN